MLMHHDALFHFPTVLYPSLSDRSDVLLLIGVEVFVKAACEGGGDTDRTVGVQKE